MTSTKQYAQIAINADQSDRWLFASPVIHSNGYCKVSLDLDCPGPRVIVRGSDSVYAAASQFCGLNGTFAFSYLPSGLPQPLISQQDGDCSASAWNRSI